MEMFDSLSLAAIVNKRFFVVHGGISPELSDINSINQLNRFKEIPKSGLYCDLLWSDPVSNDSGQMTQAFIPNEERRCSYLYGAVAVQKFLKQNKLLTMIRAHEV